jgi:pimeloyl-ACP methyl ester carboxylesterase
VGTVDVIGNSMGEAIALSVAAARPAVVRRIVLMGSMGVAMALPPGLDTVWGYTPGVEQMRQVIGLFAHDRGLITDELIEMRYRASLSPPVRDSWRAMFPEPRQRWVDDLALSGAELAAIRIPVLMVHGRDDRVVPWQTSSAQLLDLLPDSRLHVLSGCGHWTMIEKQPTSWPPSSLSSRPDYRAPAPAAPRRIIGSARAGQPQRRRRVALDESDRVRHRHRHELGRAVG